MAPVSEFRDSAVAATRTAWSVKRAAAEWSHGARAAVVFSWKHGRHSGSSHSAVKASAVESTTTAARRWRVFHHWPGGGRPERDGAIPMTPTRGLNSGLQNPSTTPDAIVQATRNLRAGSDGRRSRSSDRRSVLPTTLALSCRDWLAG